MSVILRVEPEPGGDGDVMRLNRVPTGQLTSASASLTADTSRPLHAKARCKQRKPRQAHTDTHPNVFMLAETHCKTQKVQHKLQDTTTDEDVT